MFTLKPQLTLLLAAALLFSACQKAPQVDPAAKEIAKYKDGTVLLYCQSGITSSEVVDRLQKAGYAKVYSLKGGIGAWLQDQLPVERAGKSR